MSRKPDCMCRSCVAVRLVNANEKANAAKRKLREARAWVEKNMTTLSFTLTNQQKDRLEQLAKARNRTTTECLLDFIDSCQPGGSGWQPPWKR